jgi:large subunit ribosomal protein L5
MVPRLKEKYGAVIVPALREQFGYKSVMQVPKVTKVTLNMGVGEGTNDAKSLEEAATQLGQITGQKPQIRRARKSVANFKLRAGMPGHSTYWFRWTRQLQHGRERADHFSRDRVRQSRQDPWNGYRDHHDRKDGR